MTFQVALIGSDGVIVGSDKRQLHYTPSTPGEVGALQPDLITKFVRSRNDDVVCAFAGEVGASVIADTIVGLPECSKNVTGFEWRAAIRRAKDGISGLGKSDEVIVVRKDDLTRAYLVASYSAGSTEINSCIATGNKAYPARFLIHHFYEKRPIAELRKIVLLTLYCAAIESEGRIGGGFDLMLWRDGCPPEWESIEEDVPASEWGAIKESFRAFLYP